MTERSRLARSLAALAAVVLLGGCSSVRERPRASTSASTSPGQYWTRRRLEEARPLIDWDASPPGKSRPDLATRVGALFYRNVSGGHFCTASVVDSPHRNLIVTAAHCVHGDGTHSDMVFVPGYESGATPYGVWSPAKIVIDPAWTAHADIGVDVAFVVLRPVSGRNIEDVVPGDKLGFGVPMGVVARITGYPNNSSVPITCTNRTGEQSSTQRRIACVGYAPGTSGSPWIVHLDPQLRIGTVIGVIGGYQQGGDTPDVSYSPYFGDRIKRLYDAAQHDP